MERGYDLISHGTSMVYTGVSICTEPLMIPAYNFIVVVFALACFDLGAEQGGNLRS